MKFEFRNNSGSTGDPGSPSPAPSRREFLKSAAIAGAGALVPGTGMIAQVTSPSTGPRGGRIDVHNHFIPPSVLREFGAQRLGILASWTPATALADMDASGVSTVITSIAPGGDVLSDPATAVRLCRECNEYAARLVVDYPGRFGIFAMVPMQNIDAALREVEYALDTLKADGIGMFTSYGDKWLGDPAFNPVFEELNRRGAVVYTHPVTPDCCKNLLPGIGDGLIEWVTDTSRAIARMLFSGAAARYPNVRMIWSHGGGTMPYMVERYTNLAKSPQMASKFPQGFEGAAAKFYYDTAGVANAPAMLALSHVVPVSQIVFGTDYPYRSLEDHVKGLKECGAFSARDLQQIGRENALPLLPRFKT